MSSLPHGTIVLENVHKTFHVYHSRSAKDSLVRVLRRQRIYERREILRGLSFRVDCGECVGLVGRNGAGKSTLFRLISGIMQADRGLVRRIGRVSPLIELTAGLVPDLSGRENIILNAAVLGLKRKQIAERFDSIVAFAELDEFIETPVRYYSSGMQARLGFAVAVHADADILLIDEALSVGDIAFQQRCVARMRELATSGTTVVFVSHDHQLIRAFCKRTMWIDAGAVRADGPTEDVLHTVEEFSTYRYPACADGGALHDGALLS